MTLSSVTNEDNEKLVSLISGFRTIIVFSSFFWYLVLVGSSDIKIKCVCVCVCETKC